jgi:hypothetical protein
MPLRRARRASGRSTGPALSTAAAKGANALYATHVALSHTDPEYGHGIQMVGFPKETPDDTRAGMVRASKLAAIQEAAQEHDRSVDDAVSGFLKGGGRTPAQPKMSTQEFKKRFGELSDLVSNPQALVERLQGGATLANTAPGVATAVASTAARAVQFLHDKAPKNPYAAAMPGMERAWEPSGAEVTQWGRYLRAIEDPRSVLDDMRRGSVTQEAVDAMRAVYPQLAQDVQARLTSAMADSEEVPQLPAAGGRRDAHGQAARAHHGPDPGGRHPSHPRPGPAGPTATASAHHGPTHPRPGRINTVATNRGKTWVRASRCTTPGPWRRARSSPARPIDLKEVDDLLVIIANASGASTRAFTMAVLANDGTTLATLAVRTVAISSTETIHIGPCAVATGITAGFACPLPEKVIFSLAAAGASNGRVTIFGRYRVT